MPSLLTLLLCFLCLLNSAGAAESSSSPIAPPAPDRREVWVPADRLNDVLSKNPKAVLLSRDQYETLLRDAKADPKTQPEPPVPAVAVSAVYTGRIEGDALQVHGELQVDVLTDRWTELPFNYRADSLGAVTCDGETALRSPSDKTKADGKHFDGPRLLIHGRGTHRIGADFSFYLVRQPGRSMAKLLLPSAVAAVLNVELPANVTVSSNRPFRQTNGELATSVALSAAGGSSETVLRWFSAKSRQQAGEAVISEAGSYVYSIDAERVHADLGIVLNATLGKLPDSAAIVVPSGAKVLQVEGSEVLKWSLNGDRIDVQFIPGERTVSAFRVVLETPSLRQNATAEVALPAPKVLGVGRVSGAFAILGSPGVSVRDIHTDALIEQAEGVMDPAIEKSADFVAAYRFPTQPEPPRVTVRKIVPRFDADLDTEIAFRQDGIHLIRTVALRQREGEIFEMTVKLPASEEVERIRVGHGPEPDWRRDGDRVVIRWSDRIPAGQPRVFKLFARLEPKQWTQLPPAGLPVAFEDAIVQGADKVNGYVVLRSDSSFRLEKIDAGAMEQRDGRKTPVRGDFAWFRGRDFKLALTVAKRPGQLRAVFTGYALPMEDVLDVRGELNFEALYSGVKTVRVRVPAAIAAQFNFEGPQIAERKLDGDTWSISFQKEITGQYRLALSVQAPVTRGAADESRFTVEAPRIVPLDVQRVSGTWAVEANTETEISFSNTGMNELDSLLAPAMTGYRPRHRVIGVFQFMGDAHSLKLTAVRHASAPMLTTVVDELNVDSMTGSGEADRHQARLALRTAGEQYLQVALPENAKLLSLTVDDEPVKPVGRGATLRVQLPAKRDPNAAVRVALLYETPKSEWGGAGSHELFAPKLSAAIPVLKSQWRVFVPDGYTYRNIESNLGKVTEVVTPLLVERMKWVWDDLMETITNNLFMAFYLPFVLVVIWRVRRGVKAGRYNVIWQGIAIVLIVTVLWSFAIPGNLSCLERAKHQKALYDARHAADFAADEGAAFQSPGVLSAPSAAPRMPALMDGKSPVKFRLAMPNSPQMPKSVALARPVAQAKPSRKPPITRKYSADALIQAEQKPTTAGLLPMKLDLPLNGRALVFQGYYAPERVKFAYLSGWAQARRAWFWFLLGGAAYLAMGCARPWRRTLWAILVFSFYPLCVAPSAVAACNALLEGWLIGLALERFSAWVVLREPAPTRDVPAMGQGKEAGV